MKRLVNTDETPLYYEPLHLVSQINIGETIEMDVMYKSLIKTMKEIPNDWLACHLYLEWRRAAESYYPETDTDKQIMETLGERIKNDDAFACFEPLFIGFEAYGMMIKGYHLEALQTYERALSLAREYDDLPLIADGLYAIAEEIRIEDPSRASDIVAEHNKIAEELGYAWAQARSPLIPGWIMIYRGEFDAALSHLLEFREAVESIDHPDVFSNFVLAFAYNLVRNGENALAYLNSIKEKVDDRHRNMALYYMQCAYASINVGDERKALAHLNTAQQLAVRSGFQSYLDQHQFLDGIIEKEQRDFDSAICTLETLLKRFGKSNTVYRTLCLFHLADIEVETYSTESEAISESWLNRFEKYVEEKAYPGFVAQAKILKAKLLEKQGEHEKAQAMIAEVLEVAKSPSMRYLTEMVTTYIPKISR
ncbi:MAG: hypothetical protein RTV31_01330 [Candidatus Thorarchaeota archaeon]